MPAASSGQAITVHWIGLMTKNYYDLGKKQATKFFKVLI
jgi:hypothetical protein